MSNKTKVIKKQTCYIFYDIINIKMFYSNNIKIDKVIQKYFYLWYLICDDQWFKIGKN